MKKLFFISILASVFLASCTSDELVSQATKEVKVNKTSIGFNMKTSNATRATTAMAQANHYEFGVWAYKDNSSSIVMDNYLVAFAKDDNRYSPFANPNQCSTWKDPSTNATTVPANGYSGWVYETLGKKDEDAPDAVKSADFYTKAYNTNQVLKYWDEQTEKTVFYAYTPYFVEGKDMEINTASDLSNAGLTYKSLSAFYTSPVTADYQISSAIVKGAQTITGYDATEDFADNNAELINANEALYARTEVTKGSYGNDVPLDFKHVNAKINIAFWEDVKGYKVKVIDLIPFEISDTKKPETKGIALTPATKAQAITPLIVAQPAKTNLPKYCVDADVVATTYYGGNTPNFTVTATAGGSTNDNLYFDIKNGSDGYLATNSTNARTSTNLFPTTFYALPNWQYGQRIDGMGEDDDEAGYTLHVSYTMHPNDNSADITVYDARVWIPANKCRWEAGKAYTYIFKITSKTNGTTDPDKADPATPDEPYIDPEDPRVPEDPALVPIVFDGVEVTDYDEVTVEETILDDVLTRALYQSVPSSLYINGSFNVFNNNIEIIAKTADTQGPHPCNFFKEIERYFRELNGRQVESVWYKKAGNTEPTKFVWSTDVTNSQNETGYFKEEGGSYSIEHYLATELYQQLVTTGRATTQIAISDGETSLTVNVEIKLSDYGNFNTDLTHCIPTNLNSTGSLTLSGNTLTLNAKTTDCSATHPNNIFMDMEKFFRNINNPSYGFTSIDYNGNNYTWNEAVTNSQNEAGYWFHDFGPDTPSSVESQIAADLYPGLSTTKSAATQITVNKGDKAQVLFLVVNLTD